MLSRGNSNASARLRQAKSTSSVKQNAHKPVETVTLSPETSHQHALVAASLAFDRSRDHGFSFEESKIDGLRRRHSINTGVKLGEKQSVRFTGSSAVPLKTSSITRKEVPQKKKWTSHSNAARFRHSTSSLGFSDDFIATLPKLGEYELEDGISSTPSSYRKVRKSKSMYSKRNPPWPSDTNMAPQPMALALQGLVRRGEDPQLWDNPQSGESSYRPGYEGNSLAPAKSTDQQDTAIEMARRQFLQQIGQQSLRERRSVSTTENLKKPQKAFRRTVRTSSTNSYGSAITSSIPMAAQQSKEQGLKLRRKARDMSATIKDKLKRVFKKSDAETLIPTQQLDASRAHFRDYTMASVDLDEDAEKGHMRSPTFKKNFDSTPGGSIHSNSVKSVQSLVSQINNRSRVSSWTNSTKANTVASRQLSYHKRLPIIKETGGPNQRSSQMSTSNAMLDKGYDVFQKPLVSSKSGLSQLPDRHRIYSALMKRIGKTSPASRRPNAASDVNEISFQNFSQSFTVPSKASPIDSQLSSETIRAVPNSSNESLPSVERLKISRSTILGPRWTDNIRNVPQADKPIPHEGVPTLTEETLAERSKYSSVRSKKPLREVRSTFFPLSMHVDAGSKVSPYRRIVKRSNDCETGIEDAASGLSTNHMRTTVRRPSSRISSATRSSSVYSRTTSGRSPNPSRCHTSLVQSEGGGEPGTAVIITSHLAPASSACVSSKGTGSGRSSRDWTSWMTSQVENLQKIGRKPAEMLKIYDANPTRAADHRRESTQIDSDEADINARRSSASQREQPLAILNGNVVPQSYPEPSPRLALDASFPALDEKDLSDPVKANLAAVTEKPRPWSKLSKVGGERENGWISSNFKQTHTLHHPSQSSSFHSIGKMSSTSRENADPGSYLHTRSSINPHSRYSPERAARLRRMQSSHAVGLRDAGDRQFQAENVWDQLNRSREEWDRKWSGDGLGGEVAAVGPGNSPGGLTGIGFGKTLDGNGAMVDRFLTRRRMERASDDIGERKESRKGAGEAFL